jgi:hypothetical protein
VRNHFEQVGAAHGLKQMALEAEVAQARELGVQVVAGEHRDDHARAAGASVLCQALDLLDPGHLTVAEHDVEWPPET